jgi:hypothetical protein
MKMGGRDRGLSTLVVVQEVRTNHGGHGVLV